MSYNYACVQNAVQELLKTFENSTHNNYNPTADFTTAANDLTDATAAAVAAGNVDDNDVVTGGEVGRLLPLTVTVNQTQNNNDDNDVPAAVNRTLSSRQRLMQNPNNSTAGRRPAGLQGTARKTSTSQTAVRRGRSLSMAATIGHRSARNVSSAASLDRGAAERSRDSSERLYRRSLLPMSAHQQQQQQQQRGGRDRQSRQSSRQMVVPRRRSDIGLPEY